VPQCFCAIFVDFQSSIDAVSRSMLANCSCGRDEVYLKEIMVRRCKTPTRRKKEREREREREIEGREHEMNKERKWSSTHKLEKRGREW